MKKARLILDVLMALALPCLMAYELIGQETHEIIGLYAAGLDALGWIGSSYFVDTTTLGWMVSSGYMAGESIVNYLDQ